MPIGLARQRRSAGRINLVLSRAEQRLDCFAFCFNDGSNKFSNKNLYQPLAIVPTVFNYWFGRPATLWLRLVRELPQALLDGLGNRLLNGAKGALGGKPRPISQSRSPSPCLTTALRSGHAMARARLLVAAKPQASGGWAKPQAREATARGVAGGLSCKPILALRGKPLQATRCHCVRIHRREDGGC